MPRSWFGILWRALFLASSWTWCIGMWFPVYMCKDWGWPGWAAFVVPNAIGAALVGFVHSAQSSPRFVASNLSAMRAFSVVTILFHVSWLTWLLSQFISRSIIASGWVGGAMAAIVVLIGFSLAPIRRWAIPSLIVYVGSMAAFFLASRTGSTLRVPQDAGAQSARDLWFALPVLTLGFGLCPHLDLTFHRVRQEVRGVGGAASFALSFGVFFPVLMLFTLLYAGGMLAGVWSLYLLAHFALQAAFTIGAHLRELRPGGLGDWGAMWPARRTMILVGLAAMFGSAALPWMPAYHGVPATRLVYELFMSCYALVFPAWVWIVSIDRGVPHPNRIRAWAVACVLASPCMWMGYIERQYVWLVPAVAIVLIAPVIVRAATSRIRFH